MPCQPRIAIVGGGPSGLTLGLLLHQRGIPSTIYELRSLPTSEELAQPSGMLDLHEESGLAAIRECGLWTGFQESVGDCSESMLVLDRSGAVLHSDEGELSSRPEIARNALTNLLLQNMPGGMIRWNHKLISVHRAHNLSTAAMETTLAFTTPSPTSPQTSTYPKFESTYDFVIGADGAWSLIRPLVSPTNPSYSEAHYLTLTIRHASSLYPHLSTLCGTGSLCALGGHNAIMTQRGPEDSIRVYAAVSTPDENWAQSAGLVGKTPVEAKTVLLGEYDGDGDGDDQGDREGEGGGAPFAHWGAPLRDLLATACDAETRDDPMGGKVDVRGYYMLPTTHSWPYTAGVTLIGDAAHLMLPWAGEGVNLALWDALDLARVLSGEAAGGSANAGDWQAHLEAGMRGFEAEMFTRAEEKAKDTMKNRDMFLGAEEGAKEMAGFFQAAYDEGGKAEERNDNDDADDKGEGVGRKGMVTEGGVAMDMDMGSGAGVKVL